MNGVLIAVAVLLVLAVVGWIMLLGSRSHTNPHITVGRRLPSFVCKREDGTDVSSDELVGSRSVLVFVRGSWCPFCSTQVQSLTYHYRKITQEGGKLIIVTRTPLDTTRRVADQFKVEFEFWLDENLEAATGLELVDDEDIPERFQGEFGRRTILPTVIVTDSDNIIRYSYRSSKPSDRPEPTRFMSVFEAIS